MTETVTGLWCDTFDADLLAVVPGAVEALGDTAGIQLATYCTPTNGKINCPATWWTDEGLTAFFWTDFALGPPPDYVTSQTAVVPCTFLEVVRDEWVHGQVVAVDRHVVWRPPEQLMQALMFDLRGVFVLGDAVREAMREQVRESLRAAAARLMDVLAPRP